MPRASATGLLESGRLSYDRRAWAEAHEQLTRADAESSLGADDLELLATAAYMLGRDEEYLTVLERAHHAHVEDGQPLRAARSGWWLGINLALRGEVGRGTGWIGRAQRLVDRAGRECVEQGYLALADALGRAQTGDWRVPWPPREAAAIAERHGDPDLLALAFVDQGHYLMRLGELDGGVRLLDEAMVSVTAGELSPIVTGIVYCGVIDGCQEVPSSRRAREWTAALTRWCESSPTWSPSPAAASCTAPRSCSCTARGRTRSTRRGGRRRAAGRDRHRGVGQAYYRQGELLRLPGGSARPRRRTARRARTAGSPSPASPCCGWPRARRDAAAAAMRRALGEATEPLRRAPLLPAFVEVVFATATTRRRARPPSWRRSPPARGGVLPAAAAQARGAVASRAATPGGARPHSAAASRPGGSSRRRTRAPRRGYSSRRPAGRSATRTRPRSSWTPRGTFERLGAGPDLARLGGRRRRRRPA